MKGFERGIDLFNSLFEGRNLGNSIDRCGIAGIDNAGKTVYLAGCLCVALVHFYEKFVVGGKDLCFNGGDIGRSLFEGWLELFGKMESNLKVRDQYVISREAYDSGILWI